jgi:hypothetical protein
LQLFGHLTRIDRDLLCYVYIQALESLSF